MSHLCLRFALSLLAVGGLAMGGEPAASRIVRRVTENGFVTVNGTRSFNRPLYGSTRMGFVSTGDRPQLSMMWIPGDSSMDVRCGNLLLAVVRGQEAKWLHDFSRIESTYESGLMHYTLRDPILGDATLTVDVVPFDEGDGYVVRVQADQPVTLLYAFGGFLNLDSGKKDGYQGIYIVPGGLDPAHFTGSKVQECAGGIVETSAVLQPLNRPTLKPRPVAAYVTDTLNSRVVIGDARTAVKAPDALRQAETPTNGPQAAPILLKKAELKGTGYILVCATANGEPDSGALAGKLAANSAERYSQYERYFRAVAARFVVETPDALLNAGVRCANMTMDSLYDETSKTFLHGSIRWGFPGLCGWRGAYGASVCGNHDRMASHLAHYAEGQSKNDFNAAKPNPSTGYATQAGDSIAFSRGRVMTGPYNMTEFWLDFMYWHYLWSGDRAFLKEMYPHIKDAVAYQKRALDPDNDGLYENYANTFVSDAHWYNGGGCAQSSAFTYRGNLLAAEAARVVGEDPKPYLAEAERIKAAMNAILWVPVKGFYAEYKDFMGLKRLHESPEVASVYHPIDFSVPDMFQSYQMLRYTEWGLENRYVDVAGEQPFDPGCYSTPGVCILPQPLHARMIWSSNWFPPYATDRQVSSGDNINTAQCYFRLGQNEEGFRILKATFWYMLNRATPGGLPLYLMDGCNSDLEHCDGVGSTFRAVAEGLFGLYPDFGHDHLTVQPGFPADWTAASCRTPDLGYSYKRTGLTETVEIKTTKPTTRRLRLRARGDGIAAITVDGKRVEYKIEEGIACAFAVVEAPSSTSSAFSVTWAEGALPTVTYPAVVAAGQAMTVAVDDGKVVKVLDPQGVLKDVKTLASEVRGTVAESPGFHTFFVLAEGKSIRLWQPVNVEVRPAVEIVSPALSPALDTLTFRLRNNTGASLPWSGKMLVGGIAQAVELVIPAWSNASPIIFPMTDAAVLSPGRNSLVLEGTAGGQACRLTADVEAWDLFTGKTDRLSRLKLTPVEIGSALNDEMANIFNHKYLSPRSPFASLQVSWNAFQQWCGAVGKEIEPFRLDTGLLTAKASFETPFGIPFRVNQAGNNVAFVSRFDNFPKEITVPIGRTARKVYLLISGSTTPMESGVVNAQVVVHLSGGRRETLDVVNPDNYDMCATKLALMTAYPRKKNSFLIGADCRAQLFDVPLDPAGVVEKIELRCLSNDIIVGLLGVTLLE